MKKGKPGKNRGKTDHHGQLKNDIRQFLDSHYEESFGLADICRSLRLREKKHFSSAATSLEQLVKAGTIKEETPGRYRSVFLPTTLETVIEIANNRFAIVKTATGEEIKISTEKLNGAFDGDSVKVQLLPPQRKRDDRDDKPEGEVVEILLRKRTEFVGRVEKFRNMAFVVADYRKMYCDFMVYPEDLHDARHGDKVIVRFLGWEENGKNPIGEVIKILGKAGEHEVEIHSIMAEFGLPMDFDGSVEEFAKNLDRNITTEEIARRRDFRQTTTFTIDPEDAKDFDDAISIKRLENGHWEVGVHIADVTHYVRPGSILEEEAFKRATSVYLVDRCVPMLPETLSNELCSLNPNEDKLTFAAVFELDEKAHIQKEWFGKTIIHSDRRFTYDEVQNVIETNEGDYAEEVKVLNTLAFLLRKERFKRGSINFETVEVKFRLDENGKPLGVTPKVRKDAHKLVEDFMLLANKRVAEHVYQFKGGKEENVMVYRIHDSPDPDRLQSFALFAGKFGHKLLPESKDISRDLNKLMEEIEGKPEQNILENLAVRTMAKARYSTTANGHFGLAFEHYTHFTSPIRRYPDMMVHRLLEQYLLGKTETARAGWELKCKHATEMEKKAADAERASIKYKQVEFMSAMIGKTFEGIISGVTEWGIFVEIIENKCEGLIRLNDIKDDHYDLDQANYRVVGRKSGRVITFGDKVKITVKNTDMDRRTIDLLFVHE